MDKEQFIASVELLTERDDFKHNSSLLNNINANQRWFFLVLLKMGGDIENSFKALEVIERVSKIHELSCEDILESNKELILDIFHFNKKVYSERIVEEKVKKETLRGEEAEKSKEGLTENQKRMILSEFVKESIKQGYNIEWMMGKPLDSFDYKSMVNGLEQQGRRVKFIYDLVS